MESKQAGQTVARISKAQEVLTETRRLLNEMRHVERALIWFIAQGATPDLIPHLEMALRNQVGKEFDEDALWAAKAALESVIYETDPSVMRIALPKQLVERFAVVQYGANHPEVTSLLDPEHKLPFSTFMRRLVIARIIYKRAGEEFTPRMLMEANMAGMDYLTGVSLMDEKTCSAEAASLKQRIDEILAEEQ